MKTIWKYTITFNGQTTINVSANSKLLNFGIQGDEFVLWVEHDIGSSVFTRTFQIYGTGWKIPDGYKYVGTVQNKPFVWHLYEI